MKIMLDNSPVRLMARDEKYELDFWQLQTPLSRREIIKPYGLDNGCFARFLQGTWLRQVKQARFDFEADKASVKFVTLPDVVGDARRTLELFEHFEPVTDRLPRALVLQDGIGDFAIPWKSIDAVFVGGTDKFKTAPECINACRAARLMGKWIHVGRVNGAKRAAGWMGNADSLDGSGISKFDDQLETLLSAFDESDQQGSLL